LNEKLPLTILDSSSFAIIFINGEFIG